MKKGMALITVLIVVLLLFTLVATFLLLATNSRIINERYHENLIALALAEAGADYAIWELNFGGADFDGWSGTNTKTKTFSNFQDADGNRYGNITVSINVGTSEAVVISRGTLNSITGPPVVRRIRVVLDLRSAYNYAILTAEDISIRGTTYIDSYNSAEGAYDEGTAGQNGGVATCGQGATIDISGNSVVNGDAITGPGGTVEVGGNATLTGSISGNLDVCLFPVWLPVFFESEPSLGDITLTGNNTVELFSGNYKYDSINLRGNSVLILNGDINLYLTENPSITTTGQSQIIVRNGEAEIYFDGNVDIGGQGVLNESSNPGLLDFLGSNSVSNVSLAGVGEFYGSVYAPSADCRLTGGNEIFGSVVGKSLAIAGRTVIHYDENLQEEVGPGSGYDPYLWQEKN